MATPLQSESERHSTPPPTSSTRNVIGIENPYLVPEGPNLASCYPNQFAETINEAMESGEPDNDADDVGE